jgi:hypothetical protein
VPWRFPAATPVGAEEWLLWREAVQEACAGLDVLMPDALIEPVRRAIGRLDDYGMPLSQAITAEAGVLLQARAGFRRRSHELNALGTTSWRDCAAYLQPSSRLWLAGFPALGPGATPLARAARRTRGRGRAVGRRSPDGRSGGHGRRLTERRRWGGGARDRL